MPTGAHGDDSIDSIGHWHPRPELCIRKSAKRTLGQTQRKAGCIAFGSDEGDADGRDNGARGDVAPREVDLRPAQADDGLEQFDLRHGDDNALFNRWTIMPAKMERVFQTV